MLVPSDVRQAIDPQRDGEAFFFVIGTNRVPWLYPSKYYEELVTQTPADMTPGDESLAYDQMMFAMAQKIKWDPQGRVLIPEKIMKRTGLGKEVTLIGVRDHLELWDRAQWETRREELLERRSDVTLKARQAKQKET
jgi:MraZ protein